MAAPEEIDVILDADGKSVVSAFEYVQREIEKVRSAVNQIGKDSFKNVADFGKTVQNQAKTLSDLQRQLRTLEPVNDSQRDYTKALAQVKQQLTEQHKDQLQGIREVAAANKASLDTDSRTRQFQHQQNIAAAREELQQRVSAIQSEKELQALRERNAATLTRLRGQAQASESPRQQASLQAEIYLQEQLGKAIKARGRELSAVNAVAIREDEQRRQSEIRMAAAYEATDKTKHRQSEQNFKDTQRQIDAENKLAQERAQNFERAEKAAGYHTGSVNYDRDYTLAQRQVPQPNVAVNRQAEALGERQVAAMNAAEIAEIERLKGEIESLRTLRAAAARDQLNDNEKIRAARLDNAKADATSSAREITSRGELDAARQKNIAFLERLRSAQATERDPRQLSAIADLIKIEEARARAIQQTTNALQRQENEQRRQQRSTPSGRVGTALSNTALYGVVAGLGYAAFNAVQQGVAGVVALEDEFAKLQAISNSTDDQMQNLRGTIYGIGTSSRFSVDALIKISQTLAQAGVSASEMGKVLSSVTTLAAASGSTPDEAVNLVTAALGSFQLQASEAARIADLMTSALNRTKLTVQQVGQAIQYVGATAYEQNISLETLLSTIGAVAQGGVRSGSTIGTGFRQFLVDLQTPSEKLTFQLQRLGLTQDDVNVRTRGLAAVLETLKAKGFGATQAYDGLETRAAAFYLVAKNNTDVMQDLQLSFAEQGAAAAANERAMNSLTAQWQRFKNIVSQGFAEGSESALGGLKALLRDINNGLTQLHDTQAQLQNAKNEGDLNARDALNLQRGSNFLIGAVNPIFGIKQTLEQYGEFRGQVDGTAASFQQYATRIKEASERADQHATAVNEVDQELLRLKTQQKDLIGNQRAAQAETVTLTSRFSGLAEYLGTTKNAYLDLIQAMNRYRGAESGFLAQSYDEQANAQARQNNLDRGSLTNTLRGIRNNSALMAALRPNEITALNNPSGSNFSAIMTAAADRIERSNNNLALSLRDAAVFGSRSSIGGRSVERLRNNAGLAYAASTPYGQSVVSNNENLQTRLDGLSTQSQADRTRNGNLLTTSINSSIAQLQTKLVSVRGKGNIDFLNDSLTTLRNMLGQVAAAIRPSQQEIKDAKTAAREQAQAEREAARRPKVSQQNIDSVLRDLGLGNNLGRGNDDSRAAKAVEDALHARGLTPATGDTSAHTITGGIARDVSLRGISDDRARELVSLIRQQLKGQGIEATVQFETGRGRNQGTGRHIHVGVRPGTRFSQDRTGDTNDRYDASLDQSQVELDQQDLQTKLKAITDATTQEVMNSAITNMKATLTRLRESLTSAARSELISKGIDPAGTSPQARARMGQLQQQIQQLNESAQQKISEAILKSIDAQLKSADLAFEASTRFARRTQALAEGRLTGLGYESNVGRVPDYVRAAQEREVSRAKEAADRATLQNLPARIEAQRSRISAVSTSDLTDEEKVEKVRQLTEALNQLQQQYDALSDALTAGQLIPTNIGDALRTAATEYAQANGLAKSFKDTIILNLGGAIEQVHGNLTEMFTSIFNGSQTALQAFGNFAKGIGNYLSELAAKFVASQVLNVLFKLVGIGTSVVGSPTVDGQVNTTFTTPGNFNGGPIGRAGGGRVSNGDTMRDSVSTRLARGEWVIQKTAVDSVGDQFMANLNAQGSRALQGQKQMVAPIALPHQKMAVYVVAPGQQPSMTKDDVLVTLANDILRGGETKKLIKFVQQGG